MKQLIQLVDTAQWNRARKLISKTILSNDSDLARKMMKYYTQYVCQECLGDGFVVVSFMRFKEYRSMCTCQYN